MKSRTHQDGTFKYAQKYCEDYKYPLGALLPLSADDTKLFPALRPLYDGVKGKWYIIGTTGDPIEVLDVETLHKILDVLERNADSELATKIPLPGVPPLVLTIMPIGSKVKAAELAEWQLKLMNGLISHGFRITSSGRDGASIEHDCQCETAAAGLLLEYEDIIVRLWDLNGNIWVEINDVKHGQKTFRNNTASGARGLMLGNFPVFFEHMYTLAMWPNSPMYPWHMKNEDKMDDRAAARLFSADTLQQAAGPHR
ncbi:hypothetical protein B0H10DRAFT_2235240 [Mycena sp. CBHHK59/15]|nr:hypothetical protein B0H10DRAFT_2235240 [Mycena sp. CBHHK59/15]